MIWYRHWMEMRSGLCVAAILMALMSLLFPIVVGGSTGWYAQSGRIIKELDALTPHLTAMGPAHFLPWGAHTWACVVAAVMVGIFLAGTGIRTNGFQPGHASMYYTLTSSHIEIRTHLDPLRRLLRRRLRSVRGDAGDRLCRFAHDAPACSARPDGLVQLPGRIAGGSGDGRFRSAGSALERASFRLTVCASDRLGRSFGRGLRSCVSQAAWTFRGCRSGRSFWSLPRRYRPPRCSPATKISDLSGRTDRTRPSRDRRFPAVRGVRCRCGGARTLACHP